MSEAIAENLVVPDVPAPTALVTVEPEPAPTPIVEPEPAAEPTPAPAVAEPTPAPEPAAEPKPETVILDGRKVPATLFIGGRPYSPDTLTIEWKPEQL